jgi:uncharacterized protein YecE (DUF72 family)
MPEWKIGCSGFHYIEWKQVFYPDGLPQRRWFEYYTSQFNTLELNTTFYRFPKVPFLQTWFDQSPDDFTFSAKVPRAITHFKKFIDTERMLSDFYASLREGLKHKLACVLFQLPSVTKYSEERLARIIESMDHSFTNAIEFRDVSWWNETVFRELRKHNIIFCGISHPTLPADVIQTSDILYYRFHGIPVLYKSQYRKPVILNTADEVLKYKQLKKAFIYFNNTWGIGAIRNGSQLKKYLKL